MTAPNGAFRAALMRGDGRLCTSEWWTRADRALEEIRRVETPETRSYSLRLERKMQDGVWREVDTLDYLNTSHEHMGTRREHDVTREIGD